MQYYLFTWFKNIFFFPLNHYPVNMWIPLNNLFNIAHVKANITAPMSIYNYKLSIINRFPLKYRSLGMCWGHSICVTLLRVSDTKMIFMMKSGISQTSYHFILKLIFFYFIIVLIPFQKLREYSIIQEHCITSIYRTVNKWSSYFIWMNSCCLLL